jgi:hypothetical protein
MRIKAFYEEHFHGNAGGCIASTGAGNLPKRLKFPTEWLAAGVAAF